MIPIFKNKARGVAPTKNGLLFLPLQAGFDERGKKRVWVERSSLEFRVELRTEEKRVGGTRELGDFHETTVR